MSRENVEAALAAIDAFNRRDLDTWIGFCDPEIEYHDAPRLPGGGVHHGRDALRRHVEGYLDAWGSAKVEAEEIESADDQVILRLRYVGVGTATGIEVASPTFVAIYDFRGGRISRVRQFESYAEAADAAARAD